MALGRIAMPALAAAVLVVIGGCETIGADLNALAKGLTPTTPRQAAEMMLNPHDPDDRREGTLLIANAPFGGNPPYVRTYRDYVEHERDPLVKAAAIRALAKHGTVEDAPLIARQLTHENVQVRWEAAKGLQRIHNPQVVPDLLESLRDPSEDADVRIAIARALGQYPEDRVFQGLVAALDARELAVNVAAAGSLRTLTGQAHGLDPSAWLSWYNNASGDRFAGGAEYLYPTYQRRESWLEKLAFWTSRPVEHPAPPVGLRPESQRRTYQNEDEANPPGDAGD
jgi:HEAT repeat protein